MSETFEGFVPPTKNYFHMPNDWINICAEITNLAELKVVQYVLRHTWGYHEYDGKPKPITVDEFMYGRKDRDGNRIDKGTGLKSDRSVKDGIKAAIEDGYLLCEVDDTDKARIKKAYALKMLSSTREVDSTPQNRQVESTSQTGRIYPSEVQNLPLNQVESTPRSEKDTKERHLRKKERTPTVSAIEPNPSLAPSFVPLSSSKDKSTDPSLIAIGATQPQAESMTTRNTPIALSAEEQRIHDYWCRLGMRERPAARAHWAALSKHISNFEEMESLYNYTRNGVKDKRDKRVYPGNLVDYLDGWKQEQEPAPQSPKRQQAIRNPARDYDRMVAEVQAKIAAKAGK